MQFKAIRSERLSDKIVETFVGKIGAGQLTPGDKLPSEPVLAEMFGVSRGILREALTILQSQGYITRKPKDGTYISEPTPGSDSAIDLLRKASYRDLLEMRECLELRVVEKVIQKATQEDVDELFELIAMDEADTHKEGGPNMDYYFHFKMVEISGNALILNFINIYYDLISEIAAKTMRDESRRQEIIREHREIAEAVRQRDVKRAHSAIRRHFRNVLDAVSSDTQQKAATKASEKRL